MNDYAAVVDSSFFLGAILSDICPDEKKEASTMTVYFAKANESVWDIAKSFSSDIDMIISENSLNGDTLDADKVLIIPRA